MWWDLNNCPQTSIINVAHGNPYTTDTDNRDNRNCWSIPLTSGYFYSSDSKCWTISEVAAQVFLPWSSSLSLLHPRLFGAGGIFSVRGICPQLQEGALAAAQPPGSAPGARAAGEGGDYEGRTCCPRWESRAHWTGPDGRPQPPSLSTHSPRCAVGPGMRMTGMWREKVKNGERMIGGQYIRSEAEPHTNKPPGPRKNPLPWRESLEERFDLMCLGSFSGGKKNWA